MNLNEPDIIFLYQKRPNSKFEKTPKFTWQQKHDQNTQSVGQGKG